MQGYGSMRIAKELGLNVNTVKSYCRRHGYIGDRKQMLKSWTMRRLLSLGASVVAFLLFKKVELKRRCFVRINAEWHGGIVIRIL